MRRRTLQTIRRALGAERGTALVEFALVAPLLMLLLLAMIDFGKGFNYWIDETQLANMGARWAIVNQNPGAAATPTPLTLQQYIASQADTKELREGIVGSGVQKPGLTVCISAPAGAAVGKPVHVDVVSRYQWLPLIGDAVGMPTLELRARATMRLEQRPTTWVANPC